MNTSMASCRSIGSRSSHSQASTEGLSAVMMSLPDEAEIFMRREHRTTSNMSMSMRERQYEYIRSALFASSTISGDDERNLSFPPLLQRSQLSRNSVVTMFETVDWTHDDQTHEIRRMQMRNGRRKSCRKMLHSSEAWIFSFTFAVLTATTAAYITTTSRILESLRFGVCVSADGGVHWTIPLTNCCGDNENFVDWNTMTCVADGPRPSTPSIQTMTFRPWREILYGSSQGVDFLLYVSIGTFMATIAGVLVVRIQRKAKGSGIPEVKTILGGFVMQGVLGMWSLLIKAVALCFAVASGLSLGKEGPLVHVACCYANVLSRFASKYSKNEAQKRTMLSAAAAAGVSVAFGAPIGGVLFSYEEVSSFFPASTMLKSFFAAIVAAITLQYLDPTKTGKLTMFQVDDLQISWDAWEYIPLFFLSALGGLLGAFFVWMNIEVQKWRKARGLRNCIDITEVAAIALITLVPNFFLPFQKHASDLVINNLFHECGPSSGNGAFDLCVRRDGVGHYNDDLNLVWYMLMATALRLLQTIITFGVNVPCGLFVPSLACGALIGRSFAIVLRLCGHHSVKPGIYAMVGAAAMLGGVTRMTISLAVIMFELTGGINFIVVFMMAAFVSKFVGDLFTKGIYDECIAMNNFPFLHMEKDITFDTRACDIMQTSLLCIHIDKDNSVACLKRKLHRCHVYGMPVVTSEASMILHGFVRTKALLAYLETLSDEKAECHFGPGEAPENAACLTDYVDRCYHQCVPETPLVQVFSLFRQLGLRYCLLTTYGKVVGIITKKDFLRHMDLLRMKRAHE